MKIRAVIFDVYGTLLEVGPASDGADAQWRGLWRKMLGGEPRLSLAEFSRACGEIISREHQKSHAQGIRWPEVEWWSVVTQAVPELARLPAGQREEFVLEQIRTSHSTHVPGEGAEVLKRLHHAGWLLGLASNSQAYTVSELQEGLAVHGLGLEVFHPDLCFWSFKHGFSKPDPHVFRILSARLTALGISAAETLMVGDRLDNDIEPARAFGWETWHFSSTSGAGGCGWKELAARLADQA